MSNFRIITNNLAAINKKIYKNVLENVLYYVKLYRNENKTDTEIEMP